MDSDGTTLLGLIHSGPPTVGRPSEQVPPPLKPGDTVTLTADILGSVRSTVVPGTEPVPLPTGRRRPLLSGSGKGGHGRVRPPLSC
ncbi:hypothetical protein GCM10010269_15110 [Streptomyces humidus]|uniref:Uncharacterized protein n=1 Tax=Streptomyces humidus TaxID=52259 RepID=A0A918FTE3_9ACTN|nr:hypothetical protein GCM10010269_15110 [Streptomyces humidus]